MTKEEEKRLVESTRKGDVSAFEQIVLENEKAVFNLALRQLGNREDAEDATQEVFMKAYASIGSFRSDSKVSVWLYRITVNICIDILRKRKETVSLSQETPEGEESELDLPDSRFDPAEIAERNDLAEQVRTALQKLPVDARSILLLREIGGQSYEEIAETLQLDLGTVKSRIFRARKKLCSILAGNFSENDPSKESKGGVRHEKL